MRLLDPRPLSSPPLRSQAAGIGRMQTPSTPAASRKAAAARPGSTRPGLPGAVQHRGRAAADRRRILQRAQVAQPRQGQRRVQVVQQRRQRPVDHLRLHLGAARARAGARDSMA